MDRDMLKTIGAATDRLDKLMGPNAETLVADIVSTINASSKAFETELVGKLNDAEMQAAVVQVMTCMIVEGFEIKAPRR